jgi:transcriptional regulator with XRE-family HTH domain
LQEYGILGGRTILGREEPMKLAEVRRSRLLSMRALAVKSGVSVRTINNIEMGYIAPHLSTIGKLCAALNVDPMEVDEFRDVIRGKVLAPANV